ncbi:pilus assembly protein N-terminal domain-containing protein [Hyphomonas pacifica]|uniref:pilus assembly protein N-terminal domain-containing protein n=1 Tax=Hyphomonas pacifica TaxID=1280941 RepID=UPI000DBFDFE9|nr:pilus assembly protein N-terminal domain-containing protein [Hyphomonas pacifica]RAN32067.1 hypothetical protein HY11_05695 [Hyphomonas pacifica]
MKFAGKLCALSLAGALMAQFAIAEPLTIKADTTVPVKLRGKAGSVVLGNQRIADVAVHNESLIFITGRTAGTTNIMAFNENGDQIYAADIIVTVDTSNLVTVNRSGEDFTYDCDIDCTPVPSLGNERGFFSGTVSQESILNKRAEGW